MKDKYVVWSYSRPKQGTNPKSRWRNDCDMIVEWAYAPLSSCGTYYETSKPVKGFSTEVEARLAAQKVNR